MENFANREIQALPTPCLLVSKDQLQQNIQKMQASVDQFGKKLRPHIKTHKCIEIARMQITAGAVGITCATVAEAEAMAQGGIHDILLANEIVSDEKLDRVVALLKQADVKFCVDSEIGVQSAGKAARKAGCDVELLVEINSGANRCGVTTPAAAVDLVRLIMEHPHLRFGGLQAYNGGTSYIENLLQRDIACRRTDMEIRKYVEVIQTISDIPRISGAGTGNSSLMMKYGALTEIQSGSYVFSDTTYQHLAPEYQPALHVYATVISCPTSDRVVCDAGLKSMGTEFSQPYVIGYPNLTNPQFSEEHLQWTVPGGKVPAVGEKIQIIPSHSCTTVNLHSQLFVIDKGCVIESWPITARNCWRLA